VNGDARAEALRFYPAFTVREGKNVIEFAVRSETKGDGIHALRTRFAPNAVLFAGDDVTDEDAFAVLKPGDIGIKVGGAQTRAEHRVADPEAMVGVLQTLVRLRAR
jgi:trehalose 6-phosphate phosphatase